MGTVTSFASISSTSQSIILQVMIGSIAATAFAIILYSALYKKTKLGISFYLFISIVLLAATALLLYLFLYEISHTTGSGT